MPVICTKEKSKCEIITGRVLEKRRTDIKLHNQTLRTFSVKKTDTPSSSKFFIGTSIPNSTVKGTIIWNDTSANTIISEAQEGNIPEPVTGKTELQKTDLTKSIHHEEKNNVDNVQHTQNSSAIVSGCEKLKELQELHKLLQKSYEPKPLFAPRRPTLESIKSAIEKAKQESERNKNVGTDDHISVVTSADASTSTERIIRKRQKKKKTPRATMAAASDPSPATSEIKTKNSKKIAVNIKSNKKADTFAERND